MKRLLTVMLATLFLTLFGCSTGRGAEKPTLEEISYTSDVSAQDCFLCGDGGNQVTRWGENNIGIISLNTFEVMPIEINRYDNNGELIEENTGRMTMRMFKSEAGGFSASVMEDVDRGHADVSISFYDNETLDADNTAAFLCENCLNELMDSIYKNEFGVGVINFDTREIKVFEENLTGFGSGDFYIHCDLKESSSKKNTRILDLVIFYCPVRY